MAKQIRKEDDSRRDRRKQVASPPSGVEPLLAALLEEIRRGADALEDIADGVEELVNAAVYDVNKKTKIIGISVNRSTAVFGDEAGDEDADEDEGDEEEDEDK